MVWPDSRTEIEQGFAADLSNALSSVASPDPDEDRIESAVAGAAKPWFDTTAEDALLAILLLLDDRLGPDALRNVRSVLTPSAIVSTDAASQLLGRQVAVNSRRMIENMRRDNFRRDPAGLLDAPGSRGGMSQSQFETIYGRGRAERIAVTETTRMAEIAERSAMGVLKNAGVAVQRMWQTAEDDRVCPICAPLNDLPDHLWPSSFADGPPAHVNCRCTAVIIGLDDLVT